MLTSMTSQQQKNISLFPDKMPHRITLMFIAQQIQPIINTIRDVDVKDDDYHPIEFSDTIWQLAFETFFLRMMMENQESIESNVGAENENVWHGISKEIISCTAFSRYVKVFKSARIDGTELAALTEPYPWDDFESLLSQQSWNNPPFL